MRNKSNFFLISLRSHKKTILLITITAAATLVISSLISIWLSNISDLRIPSIGTIRLEGIEAYWDKNLVNKTGQEVQYNWGIIGVGTTRNLTLYLRNISNFDTKFNRTETDWAFYNSSDEIVAPPSNIKSCIWLTWDYDNSTIHPSQIVQVTLTLHASSSSDFIEFIIENDVKGFAFDINMKAVED